MTDFSSAINFTTDSQNDAQSTLTKAGWKFLETGSISQITEIANMPRKANNAPPPTGQANKTTLFQIPLNINELQTRAKDRPQDFANTQFLGI